jgi:phosphatidylserine/phosphatidylglycerophosphate/cardiolipin synthase-like enzyme
MTFDEQRNRFFVLPTSGSLSGGTPGLPELVDSDVIPHIGGPAYFRALKALIDQPDVASIYIAGWWLDVAFDIAPGFNLMDVLKTKSRAGVDVRVLGWIMPPDILNNPLVTGGRVPLPSVGWNEHTMRFIGNLRTEPTLADKALLNILSHPAGAVHTKLVVVGRPSGDTGFTGGIDFEPGRATPGWHDVEAEVHGPAVQPLFDFYRALWNENQGRAPVTVTANGYSLPTRTAGTTAIAARSIVPGAGARKHVQSGRTVPMMNFSRIASIGASVAGLSLPQNLPISFAPNGLFEIKQLWQKGIGGAQTYVYIEDQAFTSAEIFDWLNAALRRSAGLKVVLLVGAQDPTAPNPPALDVAMHKAVNDHLLSGLTPADINARVGFFAHRTKTIHTKSTIVDDVWALIGSANMMRRSLYTDIEHSIGFMDEAGAAVVGYRSSMWALHLGPPPQPDPALDIARWFAIPYIGVAGARGVDRLRLPFTAGLTLSSQDQTLLDQLLDVDSRDAWGSGLASLAMSAAGAGLSGS